MPTTWHPMSIRKLDTVESVDEALEDFLAEFDKTDCSEIKTSKTEVLEGIDKLITRLVTLLQGCNNVNVIL